MNSEPLRSSDVTAGMTSPRVGVVRDSMLRNPLLIKAPLGRARSSGRTIPGPDFTYGSRALMRDGGVAEALSFWRDGPSQPDLVSLNRDQMGRVKVQNQTREQQKRRGPRRPLVVPDVRFGVRNRPPSPMDDLMAHRYAQRWVEQQLTRNPTSNHKPATGPGRPAETRTSLLRRNRAVAGKQNRFTLPQFSQVPAALDTFRGPAEHQRALRTSDPPTRS